MTTQKFFLYGTGVETAVELDISAVQNIDELKRSAAAFYGIVQAEGVAFQAGDSELSELQEITTSDTPIGITVDGHTVRDVPGPQGLPWVGNYFEGKKTGGIESQEADIVHTVYPDHLGNNQRLFDKYGPIFKSTNMGKTVCQTNDPTIGQIAFTESEFFSKEINDDHPLKPIKQEAAGVFVSDTSNPYVKLELKLIVILLTYCQQSVILLSTHLAIDLEYPTDLPRWKIVHKYLPPALGPKAVRHYAPKMYALPLPNHRTGLTQNFPGTTNAESPSPYSTSSAKEAKHGMHTNTC
jgi:hypothetical protein